MRAHARHARQTLSSRRCRLPGGLMTTLETDEIAGEDLSFEATTVEW